MTHVEDPSTDRVTHPPNELGAPMTDTPVPADAAAGAHADRDRDLTT